MSEAEGEWAELLYEAGFEVSTTQASTTPVSLPETFALLPKRKRYNVSPSKGNKAVTMGKRGMQCASLLTLMRLGARLVC